MKNEREEEKGHEEGEKFGRDRLRQRRFFPLNFFLFFSIHSIKKMRTERKKIDF